MPFNSNRPPTSVTTETVCRRSCRLSSCTVAVFTGSLPASFTTIPKIAHSSDLGLARGGLGEGFCAKAMFARKKGKKAAIESFIILLARHEYTTERRSWAPKHDGFAQTICKTSRMGVK